MDIEQKLTKKERREQRRQEQKELQRGQQRKAKLQRIIKWAVIILVIGLSIYALIALVSQTSTPRPGESLAIQGRDHVSPESVKSFEYNSNPPTSGPHYAQPTAWGVYQEELEDGNVIHSLEHGGIWISYQSSIDNATKEKLEEIGRKYPGSVVVSPRSTNDAPIAVASWGRLSKLDSFDENLIVEFIKRNKNQSPEPLAR